MLKTLMAASVLSLAAMTGASVAAPASPGAAAALNADRAQPLVQEAQYYKRKRVYPRRHYGPRYVPGRRYSAPPRGWNRYAYRPYNWQTRGCVIVGPVWFCP